MARYVLHPQVGLRVEKFGALAYHYGNRRLTFLNDDRLVAVVRTGGDHDDIEGAFDAAGVPAAQRPAFLVVLERLRAAEVVTCE
jgi:putative mycofactocin binding protein MftB